MKLKGSTLKTKFGLGKRNAISRHHKWELTFEEYCDIVSSGICHYCGGKLSKTGTNLDRKDPAVDYLKDNVVPCCRPYNIIKNKFITYEEMFEIIKVLKLKRNTEKVWNDE